MRKSSTGFPRRWNTKRARAAPTADHLMLAGVASPVGDLSWVARINGSARPDQMTRSRRPTLTNASTARSRWPGSWAALIWTRIRAWPLGTSCSSEPGGVLSPVARHRGHPPAASPGPGPSARRRSPPVWAGPRVPRRVLVVVSRRSEILAFSRPPPPPSSGHLSLADRVLFADFYSFDGLSCSCHRGGGPRSRGVRDGGGEG